MRLSTCVASCGLLALVAVAPVLGREPTAVSPAARTAGAVVLGSKGFAPRGAGWGNAHPSRIFNGGDPSGLVTHIHWTRWGDSLASGRGLSSIYEPRGGYYPQLVTIELHASNLGHCTAGGPPPMQLLCSAKPVPAPKANGVGDSGFVFLGSTGHPSLARLSQDSFVGTQPVALRRGSKWGIGPISVTCTIGSRAVRCANRSHRGFTIAKSSYRAF